MIRRKDGRKNVANYAIEFHNRRNCTKILRVLQIKRAKVKSSYTNKMLMGIELDLG